MSRNHGLFFFRQIIPSLVIIRIEIKKKITSCVILFSKSTLVIEKSNSRLGDQFDWSITLCELL